MDLQITIPASDDIETGNWLMLAAKQRMLQSAIGTNRAMTRRFYKVRFAEDVNPVEKVAELYASLNMALTYVETKFKPKDAVESGMLVPYAKHVYIGDAAAASVWFFRSQNELRVR